MGEPREIAGEKSALASFQWALLYSHAHRSRVGQSNGCDMRSSSIRTTTGTTISWPYVEDQSGSMDEALKNYSIALALNTRSPWVRFSRARLYRSKGPGRQAITDMHSALKEL